MDARQKAELSQLYADIAALTEPRCASCYVPYGCCSYEACRVVGMLAREEGMELPTTDHPRMPYMGPDGCILEPYQRPYCAIHVCSHHLWDLSFRLQYFELCARITAKESEINGR